MSNEPAIQRHTKDEVIQRLQAAMDAEERAPQSPGKNLLDIGPDSKSFLDLYDDQFDPWAEGRRGMWLGAIVTAALFLLAYLIFS